RAANKYPKPRRRPTSEANRLKVERQARERQAQPGLSQRQQILRFGLYATFRLDTGPKKSSWPEPHQTKAKRTFLPKVRRMQMKNQRHIQRGRAQNSKCHNEAMSDRWQVTDSKSSQLKSKPISWLSMALLA